ncbi:MAG: DUF1697 domain-containing protein [Acidimicrobiia bacterium]
MGTWIVLLRGVNLGNHNKLAMPALSATLEAAGFTDVRTHLQSGNVVLGSRTSSEAKVAEAVAAAVARGHGIECPVVVRTPEQLDGVVAANPFAEQCAAVDTKTALKTLHVTFLDAPAPAAAFADVDPAWHSPDELVAVGREVYLWCPGGYGRTKLTPAFLERRTQCTATDRNWNTVLALQALARG